MATDNNPYPLPHMRTTIETVTPERAEQLLATNTMNRPVSRSHVNFLKKEMEAGAFKATGQSIQVSNTNKLLDGQHRLLAVVETGIPQEFVIVYDLPEEVFTVLDRGKTRSPGTAVSMAGFSNGNLRASIARMLLLNDLGLITTALGGGGGVLTGANITPAKTLAYVQANDLNAAITFAQTAYDTGRFFTQTDWAFLYQILSAVNKEDAEAFLTALSNGAELDANSHILSIRNRMANAAVSATAKLPRLARYIMVYKSWNLMRRGRGTGLIKVLPGETLPELI